METDVNYVNVLLVDYDVAEASMIKKYLKQNSAPVFRIWHRNSRAEVLRFLKEKIVDIDVIVLDLYLVDPINPKETYEIISKAAGDTPIIVMTGKKARSLAREVTVRGAADVVVRERFEAHPRRLLDAIEFSMIRSKHLRELKAKSAEDVAHHQRMLHWITGGYSVEGEASKSSTPKTLETNLLQAEPTLDIAKRRSAGFK